MTSAHGVEHAAPAHAFFTARPVDAERLALDAVERDRADGGIAAVVAAVAVIAEHVDVAFRYVHRQWVERQARGAGHELHVADLGVEPVAVRVALAGAGL